MEGEEEGEKEKWCSQVEVHCETPRVFKVKFTRPSTLCKYFPVAIRSSK